MCCAVSPTSDAERIPRAAAILCVDDSHTMLTICRTMLEASGYQVHTALDGEAGLQILKEHRIDLVIVDNRMPGMSGTELAQQIKNVRRSLPVLMFSDSWDQPATPESVDLFLNKMSGPRALRDAVRVLLSRLSGMG